LFNPNRDEDALESRLNRLLEFFNLSELVGWAKFTEAYHYDLESSITFLDTQVRVEYWVENGRNDPCIYDWMIRYNKHMEENYDK
jgi:hypothetical protein